MANTIDLVTIPADGIGPEVMVAVRSEIESFHVAAERLWCGCVERGGNAALHDGQKVRDLGGEPGRWSNG